MYRFDRFMQHMIAIVGWCVSILLLVVLFYNTFQERELVLNRGVVFS